MQVWKILDYDCLDAAILQNAGALSHARHLLRTTNINAKKFYQIVFVEEEFLEKSEHKLRLETKYATKDVGEKKGRKKKNLVDIFGQQEGILSQQENYTDL